MGKIEKIKVDGRDDWLELRKKSVGGSDAAALVGLNAYSSPLEVFMDKTGRKEPVPVNEAMRQGTDFEDYVARRFCEETGKKVRREPRVFKNSDYPFSHATIDRKVIGENAGLECKTTSILNLKKFKDGEFPENYYMQCLHYMAVCGFDKYYLAVLILNKGFKVFTIERTPSVQEDIDALMEIEQDFFENYVLKDEVPPPDGSDSYDEELKSLYPYDDETSIDLFGMDGKAKELLALKEEKKQLDQQIKSLEQEFKNYLGEAQRGSSDNYSVSWKSSTRRTFDVKRFAKDNPSIDLEPYYNENNSRTFRIKELSNE